MGSSPQMIVAAEGGIAYAENGQGTVGLLDPALAVGMNAAAAGHRQEHATVFAWKADSRFPIRHRASSRTTCTA